jgi:sulfopyruvate decarboxylase TPP-binding subunit
MTLAQYPPLSPSTVLGELKKNGVTHVVWLPDTETNWLYQAMKAEPALRVVPVAREAFAFAIAAGLFLGGKKPVVMIQNTGLLDSGNSLRGWSLDIEVPIVLMVGYRGWTRHGVTSDSVARYTERFLHAFAINYFLVEHDGDGARISTAFQEAANSNHPVAVLIADEYHGFNRQGTMP